MRQLILIFLVSIVAIACQRSSVINSAGRTEKQRLANQIRRKAATQIKQDTNLQPCGTIGQMLREIQILGLSFYYYQPVDITEGRKLLVKAVDTMMQEVNHEPHIHPYLVRYPFKPRNVEIRILLRNSDGNDVPVGALWGLVAAEGNLQYQVHNPVGNGIITVYEETYEEAVQRIADPSLPLAPFQPDPEISQEELEKLRKSISFVSEDGSIWHLDERGLWAK